jgi:sortase (surface protein transpeptidase)
MTPQHPTWVASIVLALLMVACGGGPGPAAPGAEPAPGASGADAEHHADHADHGDHGDHGDDGDQVARDAATSRTGTTEQTLAAIRAMDPERLAGLHDHGHTGGHEHDADQPDAAPSRHPNGVDPERIVIPAIGVDADVIDLGLRDDGAMEVPADFEQAGWFTPGPRPGRVGPAVIAGHVDSRTGPAVFFRLPELEVGDEIEIHGEDGEVVTFVVRASERHAKADFPTERVYAGTPGPELRLITCGGVFDESERSYRDNLIVYAERLGS